MARRSRQTCAGLTAQSQSKVALDLAQAPGATRPGSGGDGGQAFGEDPPGALGGAAKTACLDPDQHGTPLPGQIGKGPEVPAVDPARGVATDRAAGLRSLRSGRDGDGVGGRHDLLDQQARGNQRENVFGQACNWINGVSLLCAHPTPFCPPASSSLRMSQNIWHRRSAMTGLQDDRSTKGPLLMGTIERDRQSPSYPISALIVTASPAPAATTPESGKSLERNLPATIQNSGPAEFYFNSHLPLEPATNRGKPRLILTNKF
jgi:hypothetical protein